MQEIRRAVIADLEGGLEASPASDMASICTYIPSKVVPGVKKL